MVVAVGEYRGEKTNYCLQVTTQDFKEKYRTLQGKHYNIHIVHELGLKWTTKGACTL